MGAYFMAEPSQEPGKSASNREGKHKACQALPFVHAKKNTPYFRMGCFYLMTGGTSGGRTHDKRIKSPLLYQLSYGPYAAVLATPASLEL